MHFLPFLECLTKPLVYCFCHSERSEEDFRRPEIGYSLATGIVIALVCFFGLTALLLAVVLLVAILPILLYIGLVIGARAFQATPAKYSPAVVLAIMPNIAAWTQSQIDGALNAAGTWAAQVGLEKLMGSDVAYQGMALLGGGAGLAGLVLGAIAAFSL